MRALTLTPGEPGSGALVNLPDLAASNSLVLVQTLAVGVCGTDREILDGHYGSAPQGTDQLILGHESLGRVVQAPRGSSFAVNDLVAAIVRHPDPVPCPSCAADEWDMCRNGLYTEAGIKERQGFCVEFFQSEPGFLVRLDPSLGHVGVLLEPASVVAKAWEHIERIGNRVTWRPRHVLITGAGPIGLLAALMGMQRGLEVCVYDRNPEGPKPQLVRDLGARYFTNSLDTLCGEADVVIECTGVGALVFEVIERAAPAGIVCLTGLSSGGRMLSVDGGMLNRTLVLENNVVFGSVNANRRHYLAASEALAKADRQWLERLITRRVPLDRWHEAIQRQPFDVKTVIDFTL